ncbi:MAG: MBL fold metallo-hydrolase, partial [Chloroflexota bacterium]
MPDAGGDRGRRPRRSRRGCTCGSGGARVVLAARRPARHRRRLGLPRASRLTGSTWVISRRTLLRDLGHGAFALTVIGLAGCAPKVPGSRDPVPSGSFDPLTYVGNLDEIEAFWCDGDLPSPPASQGPPGSVAPGSMPWARIGDERASGYILVRGGEATVVDTGPWCVPDVIAGALMAVGLDWSAVGSVIVTHKHPDHWVGLSSALEHAADADVF